MDSIHSVIIKCANYVDGAIFKSTHCHSITTSHGNKGITWMVHLLDKLDSQSLNALLMQLDTCILCPGHPHNHLVEMVSSMMCKLTSQHGDDIVSSLDLYTPVQLNCEVYVQTVWVKCGCYIQYRDSPWIAFHKKLNPADYLQSFKLGSTLLRSCNATRNSNVGTRKEAKGCNWKADTSTWCNIQEPQMHDDLISIMEEMSDKV